MEQGLLGAVLGVEVEAVGEAGREEQAERRTGPSLAAAADYQS